MRTFTETARYLLIALCVLPMLASAQTLSEAHQAPVFSVYSPSLVAPPHVESSPTEATVGEPSGTFVSPDAQWDLQFEYSVSDSVGYFSNAGAFWTGTEFWVSKWNSDTLAALDTFGSLIQVFTIPGVSGVRSVTSDGNNMFVGTANALIREVDPVLKTVVSTINITGAGSTIGSRFLTYDPTLDGGNGGFYFGNFTSDIAAVSMTGATLFTIPQTTHGRLGMYGAAYDGISAGGPYLWVFEQPTTPSNAVISQLQLPAGTWTGVSLDVEADLGLPGALAGGLFITSGLVPGENTIGGLAQGTPNTLVGYELDFVPIPIDAAVSNALPSPALSLIPDVQLPTYSFTCDISNFGFQPILAASVDVEVTDLETNTVVYSASSTPATLNAASTQGVSFGSWSPTDTSDYFITMKTNTGAQTDPVSNNDSISFFIAITDSILGRDQGDIIGNFGVGAGVGQNAALATRLELSVPDTLTSVSAFFGTPPVATNMFFTIYPADPVTGNPQPTPIGITAPYTFTQMDADSGVFLTLPLAGNGLGLPAGDFFIAANEIGTNIGLSVSSGLYEAGNLWFRADNIAGGVWQEATNQVVLIIRGNFYNPPLPQQISFEGSGIIVPEDTGTFDVFVDISGLSTQSTDVSVSLGAITATPGSDFQFSPTTITFPANSEDSIAVPVSIIDDLMLESTETLELVLTSPTNSAILATPDTFVIQILDNDNGPTVNFATANLTVTEGDAPVVAEISIANPAGLATDVDLTVSGSADAGDYMLSNTTVTFPASSTLNESVTVTITDDMLDEDTEELILVLTNPTNNGTVGAMDSLVIEILDDDFTVFDIAELTNDSNSDGLADSLGVEGEIRGVVYGVNLSSSGVQFTVIDSTDGIQVFSFNQVSNYVVTEGDSVHVQGSVGAFNGLTQFDPDSIALISQGNPLKPARVEILPKEADESQLIRIECVKLMDPMAWPSAGNNANLDVTNGTDIFTVRIDKETNLDESTAPDGWFNITGIGGQFDQNPPYMSGYQLLPRYVEDIDAIPNPEVSFLMDSDMLDESVGSYSFDLSIIQGLPDTAELTLSVAGTSTATEGVDFTLDPFNESFVGCGDSTGYSASLSITDDTDLEGDETIVVVVEAMIGMDVVSSDTMEITITETDNLFGERPALGVSLYPNPGRNILEVSAEVRMESIQLLDLRGKLLYETEVSGYEKQIGTETLPAGVYLIQVVTSQGTGSYRWIRE